MSAFSEAFEKFLLEAMTEWAENHKGDAEKAFNEYFGPDKLDIGSDRYYGWQGPFAYQLRWKGEAVVKAEVITGAALYILRELADLDTQRHQDGSEVKPSDVLEEVRKSLRATIKEALRNSNSGFYGQVVLTVAQAGMELNEDHWEFNSLVFMAEERAKSEVVPEEIKDELNKWRGVLSELKAKRSGMRSETRIAKIEPEIAEAERQIAIWEGHREIVIERSKQPNTTAAKI